MKKIFSLFLFSSFFIQIVLCQSDTLYAFTHPKFFYSMQCECSRFDFDHIYLSLYDTNAQFQIRTIIPANFDVGHMVTIIGKRGDSFKIKFCEKIAPEDYEQDLEGKEFCVKMGELGIWLYNYSDKLHSYIEVPLFEKPSPDSKILSLVDIESSVAIILDVSNNWMFVETIGKKGGTRGWLSPANQCGSPYGLHNGTCN